MLSWTALVLRLNAAAMPSAAMQALAEAAAGATVVLAPVLLTCLWAWGPPTRRAALIAAGAGVFAGQGINLLLGLAWFDPRPLVVGAGHTWLDHVVGNGFPSDHATLAWSLGLDLVLTGASRRWGAAACLAGAAAGWVRVHRGIQFPANVLASIPAGLLATSQAARRRLCPRAGDAGPALGCPARGTRLQRASGPASALDARGCRPGAQIQRGQRRHVLKPAVARAGMHPAGPARHVGERSSAGLRASTSGPNTAP